jgi:hypothetical protein
MGSPPVKIQEAGNPQPECQGLVTRRTAAVAQTEREGCCVRFNGCFGDEISMMTAKDTTRDLPLGRTKEEGCHLPRGYSGKGAWR